MNETMDEDESTDWITTEVAEVRVSGPANKARTITVPGDAHYETVERRALMVARYVLDYDASSVGWINGRLLSLTDGSIDENPIPEYNGGLEA